MTRGGVLQCHESGRAWSGSASHGGDIFSPNREDPMARHIIIVDSLADCEWARKAGKAVTLQQYVETPEGLSSKSARVINLSGDLEYLDLGYYCSLLAEARGQKVVPTVETILNLSRKQLYSVELPDLNYTLRDEIKKREGSN